MKKMKKLLSVLLAVVISLSCMSVMASAAKATYQTVDNLDALDAYSPYGTVTRLTSEERTSIFLDFLDNVLYGLNIKLNDIDLLGLATIKINLTSVDNILASLDSFAALSGLIGFVGGLLGDIKDLELNSWKEGMSRANNTQEEIVFEIFELLASNTALINNILTTGIQLGLVASFMTGVDLSGINNIVTNLPNFVKGLVLPLFERWDHTTAEIQAIEDAISGKKTIAETLAWVVEDFLTRDQSLTTVKADANGNLTSNHKLPTSDTRQTYAVSADKKTITVSHYYTQTNVDKNKNDDITAVGYKVTGSYKLEKETDAANAPYVYREIDKDGNYVLDAAGQKLSLKYYEPNSGFLPSFAASGKTFDVTKESGANLLYKMIPYVFDELAIVPANGSLKQVLAKFFGTTFKYVGEAGSAEVAALGSDTFFTQEKGDYPWGWSDYAVINGVHYYRYEDQIFVGDTSKANEYMNIINWDYKVTSSLLSKYIPADTNSKSAAGYSKILHGINDFLIDAATEVANLDVLGLTGDNAFTKGDNTNLAENLRKAAKAVLSYHPEHIFGSGYADPDHYYNLIISDDKDEVLTGVAALAVDGLAKQMILPGAVNLKEQGVKVGGILAAMVRELATQLLPHYNYDALIYSDYNTKTFLKEKTNSYWLDVILTMGVDIGMKYLHNLADMNEDTQAWKNLGYGSESMTTPVTYTPDSFSQTGWEAKVDYILDWALTVTEDGSILTWNMANLVGDYVKAAGCTINLETAEDPWVKLDAVLDGILFLDQFTSETDLEKGLRGTIEDLVNLNLGAILGTETDPAIIDVPASSRLVSTNLLEALSLEVRDLINGLFKQVGGGSYYFIPTSITSIDGLLGNIATIATNLVGALDDAINKGLLKTVLPILNIFIGWVTDPQKYATPTIGLSSGANYVYDDASDGTATVGINLVNNSAGMLLRHRANIKSDGTYSSEVDKPYVLTVKSVVCDVAGTTFDKTTSDIQPYGRDTFTATVPFTGGNVVAKFTITYAFKQGKDGNKIGSDNVIESYVLISNVPTPYLEGRESGDDNTAYSMITAYNQYVATQDLYTAVTTQTATIMAYIDTLGAFFNTDCDRQKFAHWTQERAMASNSSQYFENIYPKGITGGVTEESNMPQEIKDAGWRFTWGGKEDEINKSTTGRLFNAKAGVTADTEFPYGIYNMGTVNVGYAAQSKKLFGGGYRDKESDGKFFSYQYIYYTKFGAEGVMSDYVGKQLRAADFSAAAQDEFVTYEAALKNVVMYAQYPVTTDFVETIQPNIEAAIEALNTAYEALMAAEEGAGSSAESADIAEVEALIATDDGDGEVEINYQDYDLFEYFEYQDYRTTLRNIVAAAKAPEVLDKYYIAGSGITYDELSNDVIPGAANETIKAAITASMTERDAEEIAASQEAHDNFVAPYVDELYLDDQMARYSYYKQFILPIKADLTFLNKEIGYADANYPASAKGDYTADSWANYIEKYNAAKAITDADLPSKVFDAKWQLMLAMKNLLLKSESAIEQGATADLIANKAIADSILAMDLAELKLSQVAVDAGLTVEDALGALITALGYKYTGRDGNEYDLYADSAIEYIENDRPNVSTNISRINKANANLETAIAYFDVAVEAPVLGAIDGTTGVVGETTVVDGVATGYIYGVKAGDTADNYFELVDESTGTVEWTASTLGAAGTVDGTGAVATVKDNNGNVVAKYTLVIFGDLDGDSKVNDADKAKMNLAILANSTASLEEVQVMASDLDANDSVNDADKAKVNIAIMANSTDSLPVNPFGA